MSDANDSDARQQRNNFTEKQSDGRGGGYLTYPIELVFDPEIPAWCVSRIIAALRQLCSMDAEKWTDALVTMSQLMNETEETTAKLLDKLPIPLDDIQPLRDANHIHQLILLAHKLEDEAFKLILAHRVRVSCCYTAVSLKPLDAIRHVANRLAGPGASLSNQEAFLKLFNVPLETQQDMCLALTLPIVREKFIRLCGDPEVIAAVNLRANSLLERTAKEVSLTIKNDADALIAKMVAAVSTQIIKEHVPAELRPLVTNAQKELKKRVVQENNESLEGLGLKFEAGRLSGTSNKRKSKAEKSAINNERELEVIQAMLRLLEQGYRRDLNVTAVSRELPPGKSSSRTKLNNWIKESFDFETMCDIAQLMHRANIRSETVNERSLAAYKKQKSVHKKSN